MIIERSWAFLYDHHVWYHVFATPVSTTIDGIIGNGLRLSIPQSYNFSLLISLFSIGATSELWLCAGCIHNLNVGVGLWGLLLYLYKIFIISSPHLREKGGYGLLGSIPYYMVNLRPSPPRILYSSHGNWPE